MKIILQPYAAGDCEAVASLWLDSWKSTDIAVPDAAIKTELKAHLEASLMDGWAIHVAVWDSKVVAFLALNGDKLEQLFVAPRMQGRGIGKQLLDFVKTE